MAPVQNVRQVKQIAEDELHVFPIVTESNRWINVEPVADDRVFVDLDSLRDTLEQEGYRAKVLGNQVKATKRGIDWPAT